MLWTHRAGMAAAFLGSLLLVTPAFAAFSDVPSSHVNADAIAYVQTKGIVQGYADGSFKPDAPINRAEFVQILMNAIYGPSAVPMHPTCFSDVDSAAWYNRAVCLAVDKEAVGGYSDGTFRPAQNINFAEAAKIITNVMGSVHVSPDDISPYFPWYKLYIDALANQQTVPTDVMSFDSPLTRGQMAELIFRLQMQNISKPSKTYNDLAGSKAELIPFENIDIPLSFSYPIGWGDVENNPFAPNTYTYQFSELKNSPSIEIDLLPYDTGVHRFVTECQGCGEGSSAEQHDLIQEKVDLEAKTNVTVAGYKALEKDFYSGEGGNLSRSYEFFSKNYRVQAYANYGIDPAVIYPNATGGTSVTELVQAELGLEAKDPIHRLIQKHPDQNGMKQFYDNFDAFVQTMNFSH